MSLILGQRSLDAGYGRWMLMVRNEYNDDTDDVDDDDGYDDDDDDGDDCGYAIRPMEVFEITNLWSQLDGIRITSCAYQIEITSSPLSEVARQCEAWSILPTP